MTDGGSTSSWDVDKGESPYRLAFYEVAKFGVLAVEKEDESLTNHSHTGHNTNFSDIGGNGAAENKIDSNATGPSASSAFAKDEASYMPTSMPGWWHVDSIDNKTMMFASNATEGSIITADYKRGDLAMGIEDKQKEETMVVVEENAGQSIGYFAMTDGGLLSSWNVDKDESPHWLAFYEVTGVCNLTVEKENESLTMGEGNKQKEKTTAVVEEDAGRNREDLAKTGGGTLEGSTDCDEPEPVLVFPSI
jgi:hypothetical protein